MIPFNDPRLTAIGLLSEVHAGLTAKTTPALVAAGMSEIDFETLLRLARSPHRRLRMSDLAAQTNLSTSGVTRVVDRLNVTTWYAARRVPPTAAPRTRC
ncbi:MarR family transcriptional regulator [Thermocatellispora tengchongensis]|uniref:MarR family transcriptional regulator n=1 Tax=Thermocatellispora tengchongensis TaxID=1073253 RepID=UPI003645EA88